MLEVYRGLSPLEKDKLIKYKDSYQRFHTLVNFSNDTYIDKPENHQKICDGVEHYHFHMNVL